MNTAKGDRESNPVSLLPQIEKELEYPRPYEQFLDDLKADFPRDKLLLRLIQLKDKQHRFSFYVKSEHVWYRRFGWRIMRPLFIVAVLAGIGFIFQRVVDPALGFAAFLAGAGSLYLAIQFFAQRWMNQSQKRLDKIESEYRIELERIRDELQANR